MRWRYVLLTLVTVGVACSACIIIPIPTPGKVAADSRGRLADETLTFLEEGRTTREAVLLALGEPERAWREERLFLYYWEPEPLWVLAAGYGGGGGAAPISWRVHFLLLEFDEAGLLTSRKPGDFRHLFTRDFRKNPFAYRSLGFQREIPQW